MLIKFRPWNSRMCYFSPHFRFCNTKRHWTDRHWMYVLIYCVTLWCRVCEMETLRRIHERLVLTAWFNHTEKSIIECDTRWFIDRFYRHPRASQGTQREMTEIAARSYRHLFVYTAKHCINHVVINLPSYESQYPNLIPCRYQHKVFIHLCILSLSNQMIWIKCEHKYPRVLHLWYKILLWESSGIF